jgi:FKBP-type peptidyl-prolyl cis-trans isomerase
MQPIFAQSYYGTYIPVTATPQKMSVSGTIDGFSTALQYMVEGDDWLVYIPQKMAYATKESSTIPAYSTLLYRMHVVTVHRQGLKE